MRGVRGDYRKGRKKKGRRGGSDESEKACKLKKETRGRSKGGWEGDLQTGRC